MGELSVEEVWGLLGRGGGGGGWRVDSRLLSAGRWFCGASSREEDILGCVDSLLLDLRSDLENVRMPLSGAHVVDPKEMLVPGNVINSPAILNCDLMEFF